MFNRFFSCEISALENNKPPKSAIVHGQTNLNDIHPPEELVEAVKSEKENIVIIGSGPAGLASTIEAFKNNHKNRKITMIFNRDKFTRTQVFRFDSAVFPCVESLIGDEAVNRLLRENMLIQVTHGEDTYYNIQINTLEHELYMQIKRYKDINMIHVPDSNEFRINRETSQIEFKNELENIPFKYIIACDGSKHSMANNISENDLIYDTTQSSQIHDTHLTAVYKLPASANPHETYLSLLKKDQDQQVASKKFKEMGWELNSTPEARIFVVNKLLYIGTECPKSLFVSDQWARTVLELYLPVYSISALTVSDSPEQSPFGKFTVQLEEANLTVMPLGNYDGRTDAFFFQIGDALRKPHYQTWSGAVTALLEAKELGLFFSSEESCDDLLLYHSKISAIRADNRARVESYLESRKLRELKSLVEKFDQSCSLQWPDAGLSEILSFCTKNKDTALSFLKEISNPSRKQRILGLAIANELIASSSTTQKVRCLLSAFEQISYIHDKTDTTSALSVARREWNGVPISKGFQNIIKKCKEKIVSLSGKDSYQISQEDELLLHKPTTGWGIFKNSNLDKFKKNVAEENVPHKPSRFFSH